MTAHASATQAASLMCAKSTTKIIQTVCRHHSRQLASDQGYIFFAQTVSPSPGRIGVTCGSEGRMIAVCTKTQFQRNASRERHPNDEHKHGVYNSRKQPQRNASRERAPKNECRHGVLEFMQPPPKKRFPRAASERCFRKEQMSISALHAVCKKGDLLQLRELFVLRSLVTDLGQGLQIKVCADNSGAKGNASRKGIAKLRHPHTTMLWTQQKVTFGEVQLFKCRGELNRADLGANDLARDSMERFLSDYGKRKRL
eukprot:4990776-Amphidinium_carterae.1